MGSYQKTTESCFDREAAAAIQAGRPATAASPEMRALLHARQLLMVLLGADVTLMVSGFVVSGIPPEDGVSRILNLWFHLDGEATIPAWFSSMQWFAVGLAFLVTASHGLCRQLNPSFLFLIGLGCLFLAFDEAIGFHERLTALLRHLPWMPRFKGGNGIWILVYLSIAAALVFAFWRQIVALVVHFRTEVSIMLFGFSLVLLGAVGLEIISYLYLRDGHTPFLYRVEVVAEEGLELAGTSILLYGAILFALRAASGGRQARPGD